MAKKSSPSRQSLGTSTRPTASKFSWFEQHPVLSAAVLFFTLMLLFFYETIFASKTYVSPDAQAPAMLTATLRESFWREGTLPQWMPYIFGGMPSCASLTYSPFAYFPGAIIEIVSRILPIRGMLTMALHYVLAGLGVFLFLKRRGAGFIPALFGGIAFMLTPYMITMTIFGHGSQIMTAAYIPLALWAVDRLFEKFSWLNLGLSGLIVGLMLQRGHVQVAFYGLLLLGFFLLYQIFISVRRKEIARIAPVLGGFLATLLLGFALAAILFLPLQEYTPFSIRGSASVLAEQKGAADTGVGFDYATQWSFAPGEMMTFLVPSFYGFGGVTYWGNMPFTDYPNYMGILVLAFALVALVKRVPLSGFFGVAIVLALLLSFGHNFASFYRLFYDYFPYFNKFRVPVMILVLVQCLVAILAGMGLHALLSSQPMENKRGANEQSALITRRLWIAFAGVLGVVLLITLAQSSVFSFMQSVYPDRYEPATQQQLDQMRFSKLLGDLWIVALVACTGLAMLALHYSKKISGTSAALAITLVSVLDLWIVDKKIGEAPTPERNVSAAMQPDAISNFLKGETSKYRILPVAQLFNEMRWAAHGVESVGGYHAAKPRRYQDLMEATNLQNGLVQTYFRQVNQGGQPALQPLPVEAIPLEQRRVYRHLLDMLNTKYLISQYPLPEPSWVLRQTFSSEQAPLFIYENTTVLPRAYLVGKHEVIGNDLDALTRLRRGDFDPHQTVLLNTAPKTTPAPDSTAQATLVKYSLHEIVVETQSSSPQILVLSDNYYPIGWHAYLDGQPVETLLANYAFRGVEVPDGKHRVEFRYASRAFAAGTGLSLGALAVIAALLLIGWRKSKNDLHN